MPVCAPLASATLTGVGGAAAPRHTRHGHDRPLQRPEPALRLRQRRRVALRDRHDPRGHQGAPAHHQRRRVHVRVLGGQLVPVLLVARALRARAARTGAEDLHVLHEERAAARRGAHRQLLLAARVHERERGRGDGVQLVREPVDRRWVLWLVVDERHIRLLL